MPSPPPTTPSLRDRLETEATAPCEFYLPFPNVEIANHDFRSDNKSGEDAFRTHPYLIGVFIAGLLVFFLLLHTSACIPSKDFPVPPRLSVWWPIWAYKRHRHGKSIRLSDEEKAEFWGQRHWHERWITGHSPGLDIYGFGSDPVVLRALERQRVRHQDRGREGEQQETVGGAEEEEEQQQEQEQQQDGEDAATNWDAETLCESVHQEQ